METLNRQFFQIKANEIFMKMSNREVITVASMWLSFNLIFFFFLFYCMPLGSTS